MTLMTEMKMMMMMMMMIMMTMIMRTIDADGEVGVTSVGSGDNELR